MSGPVPGNRDRTMKMKKDLWPKDNYLGNGIPLATRRTVCHLHPPKLPVPGNLHYQMFSQPGNVNPKRNAGSAGILLSG